MHPKFLNETDKKILNKICEEDPETSHDVIKILQKMGFVATWSFASRYVSSFAIRKKDYLAVLTMRWDTGEVSIN